MIRSDDHIFLGQRLVLYRADPTKLDNRFLLAAFQSDHMQGQIKSLGSGATVEHMRVPDAEKLNIKVPAISVQNRIGDILCAYDDLIENNSRRIKILEQMAQMLYREWFVHFRFPGHKKTKLVESETGGMPEGWKSFPFSDLVESALGGEWGAEESTQLEKVPVRVVRGTDFDDLRTGNTLRVPRRFITESSFQRRELAVGDIVVENSVNAKTRCAGSSIRITEGMRRRLGENAIAASFCRVFRPKSTILSSILTLHMQALHREGGMSFYQNVAANGIANFQTTRFLETERIALPSTVDDLAPFIERLEPFVSSNSGDRIHNLRTTRDLLLPKLISGEISFESLETKTLAETV
jgi:type I restriction enzyme, S subunit